MTSPRPHDVSADDLRFLLAVARTGKLVSAATLLGVEHTTVRRRIDRLESALGSRLLDRGVDGWQLTEIGKRVAESAGQIEQIVERSIGAAAGDDGAVRGTVRVVAPEGFGTLFVVPAIARVQRKHPGVRVELVTSTRPLSVRGSGYDIAITVGSASSSRLAAVPLAPYSLRLYASRDYLARHAPINSVADLEQHPLVFYVDALLTVRELDLAPVLTGMTVGFGSTNVFAQLEATRQGAGIGLLHAFMGEPDPGLEPVLPSEIDFRLQFSIAVRKESLEQAAVAIVRDAIAAETRERAAELGSA